MRRQFLISVGALGAAASLGMRTGPSRAAADAYEVDASLRALEKRVDGRLGVYALDTGSGESWGYRADERFLLCSTFKVLSAAFVLHRVDRGLEWLSRRMPFGKADLLEWAPVAERKVDGGSMSLGELCAAAITVSDNTAANLMFQSFGGPAALTAYLRGIGDDVTRLDRTEPALNDPDGALDTTSPRAMANTLRRLLLGDALSAASREQLTQWMLASTTGGARLKAGLPRDWRSADKTGTGRASSNDVAIVWPPGRSPLLVAAYLTESRAPGAERDAVLAAVGARVAERLRR